MNHVRAWNARDKSFQNFLGKDILRFFQFLLIPPVNIARWHLPITPQIFLCISFLFLFIIIQLLKVVHTWCRSQLPRGLRLGSAAFHFPGLRVRIPPEACKSVSCDCCVLSDIGICVGLISRPEGFCRVLCVSECDHEALITRRPWPTRGLMRHGK